MSTNIVIVIHDEDDGPYDIKLNEELICSASYCEDGSNGMRKLVKLVEDLTEAFNIPVIKRYQ